MGLICWPKEPIDDSDIALLIGILRRWCEKNRIHLTATESLAKAKDLVEWFEFGVKDPDELEGLINE
ncbi:hypothetical protein [Rhizobium leguminosarum]|uniref:hypothetical protein n=1 Tax=Rhizobium leguminosarum TaxID=384 RepID=UPI00184CA765|nr:hypothetical protein [Rhizobium leguminosarum]MBA9035942.1 hypothetical protein [Rhizobium leguminosarum]MDI5929107.1 hypothetical protein [Rhizobium leguminosarum]